MVPRASLLALVLMASGCLHHAQLTSAREAVEIYNAPVKCGPMGFRRVPLASRFGEYVRLTVSSPVALSGSVLVHANGVAHPARVWSSEGDGLVIEARFENTDPDLPSALRATQPIDVTIAELTAPAGGTCEGAVFTLEHGRLLAPTTDALWIAELERRGGAALAARREARRRMNEEELAAATQSAQPEFSTVLAGWNEPETETENTTVAQMNLEGVSAQTSIAQAAELAAQGDNIAVAQVNLNGTAQMNREGVTAQTSIAQAAEFAAQGENTAVAQVNLTGDAAAAVAQMNHEGVTAETSVAQAAEFAAQGDNTAVAQVNLNGTAQQPTAAQMSQASASAQANNTAVAQVNLNGTAQQPTAAQMSQAGVAVQSSNTAVAQVNIGGGPSASAPQVGVGAPQNAAVAQVTFNGGPSAGNSTVAVGSPGNVAVAQVNVSSSASAPDFTHSNDPFAYDDGAAQRGAVLQPPPLPSVGAMFPPGCTELSCVVPASQCTQGCTPAPGTCTASSCTVNGQQVEFAVYPRGCVSQACAMPVSRCVGACSRAPGAFVDGTYACPVQRPLDVAVANTEWETPPTFTTQVAHEVPRVQPQVIVAAPPPPTEVEVEVLPLLPWLFGAALAMPAPVPVVLPQARYAPTPRYVPMHRAQPVGPRARR